MATLSQPRPFGRILLPAVRAINARGLRVVRASGDSSPAQVSPPPLRQVFNPLRFKLG